MKPDKIIETLEIAMAEVEWNYPMKFVVAFKAAIEAVKENKNVKKRSVQIINEFAAKVKQYPNDFSHYDFDEFVDEIAENLKEKVYKNG